MNSSFKGLSRLFSLLVVSVVAVAFVGCGSSNDLENFVRNNTTTPVFTGQFLGANNLANNQTSNLSFTVNSNGQATGNLTVVNPVSSQTITPGTYPVTGNVSLTTGVFSLTGTIPGLGTFTARVMFYGDRYAGTWQHGKAGGHMWGQIETMNKDENSPSKK